MEYKEHIFNGKSIFEALPSFNNPVFFDGKDLSFDFEIKQLKNINKLWDINNFNEVNLPKKIFKLNDKEKEDFSKKEYLRILDMPIKFPRTDYRLPDEVVPFLDIIKKVAFHEQEINQNINDYYCYITIDKKILKKGQTTRKAGIHVDGFQGARIKEPLPIDHSYILADSHPTIFYEQPFFVGENWDMSCHNYFEGFEKQKNKALAKTYGNNTVLLIDGYCLHEAPLVDVPVFRTFLRMSYTVREFDRLGNAHNQLFDYKWEMVPRNKQDFLVCPV